MESLKSLILSILRPHPRKASLFTQSKKLMRNEKELESIFIYSLDFQVLMTNIPLNPPSNIKYMTIFISFRFNRKAKAAKHLLVVCRK
jgi:hypothetical protein